MKLSLIMPIYNGSNYIDNTISYILESNIDDFELILINDGSKDDSLEICAKYAKKDSRVKIISKENGGIADARNCGIIHAKGEYIAFVDQDDYVELKVLMDAIGSYRQDIIIFSTVKDYGNKFEPCDTVKNTRVLTTKKEIFEDCIWPMVYQASNRGAVSYLGHVWQGLYKKNIVSSKGIKFKKYVSIEDDFIFLLEFLLNSESIALITDVGYRWVVNYKSTTYNKTYIEDMQNKCEKYYSHICNLLTKSDFFSAEYQEQYIQMSKQVLGVRLVINEGNSRNLVNSLKEIKKFRKLNRKVFKGKYLGKPDSRKSAITMFYLLKFNAVLIALLLQKVIIYVHKANHGFGW